MSVVTANKTAAVSLIALQNLANNGIVISAAQDVSTKFRACFFVRVGRDVTTALTNAVNIRIQASAKASGTDAWETLAFIQSGTATAISNTLSGSSNASGQTTLTATGNFTQSDGDLCFIKNGTFANSEFVRLRHVTAATTVSIWDNLTNTQTSSTLLNKADEFVLDIDISAIARVRIVIDTLLTGQAANIEAYMTTLDSIGV